jgi:hypothetical protein
MRFLLAVVALCLLPAGSPAFADDYPGMSHDHFEARLSVSGCVNVAQRAMLGAGYTIGTSGAAWTYGHSRSHHALFQCFAANGGVDVNLVVASNEKGSADSQKQLLISDFKRLAR